MASPAQALRIGTRRSLLALAQAREVASLIESAAPEAAVELVEITTAGDRSAPPGDKRRWVAEIEDQLLAGRVDLAVHSAKDVPGQLADGLEIVAAPRRADARDALCGAASLEELEPGARVGTSSLRRAAQLRALREDIDVVELRGNVDTRLRKLAERADGMDAIVIAFAGLQRLGRTDAAGAVLDAQQLVPAPGQGTLALEARAGDERVGALVAAIGDADAMAALTAERALVARLGADCHTPVGAYALRDGDGGLVVSAFVGLPDGSAWARDALAGPADDPAALGARVAERLLLAGAAELLAQAAQWPAAQ
jgi:hydroxymethylbilane synthase